MDIINQIRQWAGEFLEEGYFLVDVEQKQGSKKISVFIDGDAGVNVEACRKLSRQISEKLDELDFGDEAYYFEVSSPGVDRPLLLPRQYTKHIGRELLVKLKGGNELLGRLTEVSETGLKLLLKDKKKAYKDAPEKELSFDEVLESMVQISFK